MANRSLHVAKKDKNDEFYTQYSDIQKEINAYLEFNTDVFKNKTLHYYLSYKSFYQNQIRLLYSYSTFIICKLFQT